MDFDKVRTSEVLNLEEVVKHFENLGYSDLDLFQNWRHVTGEVNSNGKKRYLKLASTVEVSAWTRNEFEWNQRMNDLPDFQELSLKVPQVFESGEYEGRFWFITEFIDGSPLCTPEDTDSPTDLTAHLLDIVNISVEFQTVKGVSPLGKEKNAPNSTDTTEKVNPVERILKQLTHWMNNSDYKSKELYDYIEKFLKEFGKEALSLPRVLTHGDFVPWHIFKSKAGDLYLIDGEHGRTMGPKFYDIAYFYHRVFTKLRRPDIADEYLASFAKICPFSDLERRLFLFWLAQRTVGGYFDAKNDGVTNLEFQHKLKDRILTNDLSFE